MVKHFLGFLALALCLGAQLLSAQQAPQAPLLAAFVDRTDISINDVLTLTIRVDASLSSRPPNLGTLGREFEQVGGVSTRSTYSNTNGTIQSWNEFSIMLRPLTTGVLTIPALRVDSEVSTPIRINVGEASQTTGTGNEEIFLETSVSKEELYVQEQLLFTIKIYYAIGFDQGAQLTSPQVADAVVQQLGSDDNYQQVVNGIGYNVTERRFVIFPQSSGTLTIPPVYFSASVGRRGGINRFLTNRSPIREINLTSDTHQLNVLPRPVDVPGQTWLPAAKVELEEEWSGSLDNIEVGDAITRNVTLTAQGLSSSLLPGIQYTDQGGLRYYPDQPVRSDSSDRNGVVGKRSEGTAIVASSPGEYLLPEVRLPWWNTVTNSLETAVLPARTLRVVAPAGGTDVSGAIDFVPISGQSNVIPPAMSPASQSSGLYLFWISSTVLFAAAWLFSTMMWLRSRRQLAYAELVQPLTMPLRMPEQRSRSLSGSVRLPDAATCLQGLQTACAGSQLMEIRTALLKWGQASFEDPGILSLEELARRCDSPALASLVAALDKALYGGGPAEFSGTALYNEVAALHKRGVHQQDGAGKYSLPPLYRN